MFNGQGAIGKSPQPKNIVSFIRKQQVQYLVSPLAGAIAISFAWDFLHRHIQYIYIYVCVHISYILSLVVGLVVANPWSEKCRMALSSTF